jgi:hypothetical protein
MLLTHAYNLLCLQLLTVVSQFLTSLVRFHLACSRILNIMHKNNCQLSCYKSIFKFCICIHEHHQTRFLKWKLHSNREKPFLQLEWQRPSDPFQSELASDVTSLLDIQLIVLWQYLCLCRTPWTHNMCGHRVCLHHNGILSHDSIVKVIKDRTSLKLSNGSS